MVVVYEDYRFFGCFLEFGGLGFLVIVLCCCFLFVIKERREYMVLNFGFWGEIEVGKKFVVSFDGDYSIY